MSLWLSGRAGSRCSAHYDNYQNLLVVLAGSKTVRLWPPADTALLYPQQLGGESGNHSEVDIARPCAARHPLFQQALRRATAVTLRRGDALFIPEGFWHQVDSGDATIAVNYWRAAMPRRRGAARCRGAAPLTRRRAGQVALGVQRATGRPHGRVLRAPGV